MLTKNHWTTIFDFCGVLLGGDALPGCFNMNSTMTNWVIDLDEMKPPVVPQPLVPVSNS